MKNYFSMEMFENSFGDFVAEIMNTVGTTWERAVLLLGSFLLVYTTSQLEKEWNKESESREKNIK